MSFVPNECQQMSLDDQYYIFTAREQKFLKKSWASYFADYIFPKINEEHFSCLYSDNPATRPSTKVNVIIGALLLKELKHLTDDDVLESLLFDYRFQYALHTSSMKEQPLSDRTLGRFRARCLEYEEEKGVDLVEEEIKNLSAEIAMLMKIDGTMIRMDSMMIASNIKYLSRLELLYTCLSNLVKEMKDRGLKLPEELIHYTAEDDQNQVIYHNKSDETIDKITVILRDCAIALALCDESYTESSAYLLLRRVLSEQTVTEDDGSYRLRTTEDGGMNGNMLQNPSDPDATFRDKAGEKHRGYSANLVESVGENGSIVTDYAFEKNTHSDQQFVKEVITEMGQQETPVTIIADGAFGGTDNIEFAKANNIDLITTNLTGREAEDISADFEFSEDGKSVTRCPNGIIPKSCSYNPISGQCTVSFYKTDCAACPYRSKCHPKEFKRTCRKTISVKSKQRALQQRFRSTEEFSKYSRFRNGVETVPSYLRRAYDVDRMPVRGLKRCKLYFGFKIGSSNIKKFCKYLQSIGCGMPNTANA